MPVQLLPTIPILIGQKAKDFIDKVVRPKMIKVSKEEIAMYKVFSQQNLNS